MCVDFRSLNKQTRLDMFPIPCIHDLLDKLGKARIVSAIDLSSAYHQVRIKEGHEHKMAFLTPMGLFEYAVRPYQCSCHLLMPDESDIPRPVVQVRDCIP